MTDQKNTILAIVLSALVLIGRRAALELPFDRLVEDFDRALSRVHAAAPEGHKTGKRDHRKAGKGAAATPHAGSK